MEWLGFFVLGGMILVDILLIALGLVIGWNIGKLMTRLWNR